jgi:hypothetical protein
MTLQALKTKITGKTPLLQANPQGVSRDFPNTRRIKEINAKKANRKDADYAEMAAVDGVREMLLNEGKYIAGTGTDYRILTPGENTLQIDRYLAHAQNKIRRARKLERTSPAMSNGRPSQSAARTSAIERDLRRGL